MERGKWIKFSNGTGGSNCVEVMFGHTDVVYVRNSRHPNGIKLPFTMREWESFIEGAKQGVFDV